MTEQYKPLLKFKNRINKAQLKNLKAHTSLSPIKKDGIEDGVNDEGKPNNMSGEFSDIDPNPNFN
jgi:alcohol dehydrogenase YqhD (iron-dependent ADH family)